MACNELLNQRVRKALAHLPFVQEKKMFRGVAFLVNEKMCISAGDNELMLRIDPQIHDNVIKQKGVRTVIMRGREYKGYIYVHVNILATDKDFDYWIQLALDFNKYAQKTSKSRKVR